jgi:hypothetical protein
MRPFLEKSPFLASLGINLLLFTIFYSVFYSRFGTTDDIEMQMVLAGKMVLQEPSAYLRYTHIGVGWLLSSLYSSFPDTSWYTYCMVSAHLFGMTALLYAVLKLKSSFFRLATYLIFFAIGETVLLQELQFTSAALVLQIGAVMLLYLAFSFKTPYKTWYISAFLMLIWGSMIRWETFLLAVILGTPLLLYSISQQAHQKFKHIAFCITIIITAWGIDQWHYSIHNQDEGWATFHRYKKLMSGQAILDFRNPNYEWSASTADDYFYKVGWEYEDLQLFKHWFLADSSVYGYQQFEALQYAFQDCPLPSEHIEEKVWQFFIEYPLDDYVYYSFLILIFALFLCHTDRWRQVTLLGSMGMIISILTILFVYQHLPQRVSYGMAFYLICLSSLFIAIDRPLSRRTKIWSLLLLSLFAISNLKTVTKRSSKVAFDKMYFTQALDSLDAQPEQLYIGGGDYYMQATITPFQSLNDTFFDGFNMLDFGHLANTPTFYKQLQHFGIENIHTQAIGDSSIFLIHRYESSFLNWYANFILRHYKQPIRFKLIRHEKELNIGIYQLLPPAKEEEESFY